MVRWLVFPDWWDLPLHVCVFTACRSRLQGCASGCCPYPWPYDFAHGQQCLWLSVQDGWSDALGSVWWKTVSRKIPEGTPRLLCGRTFGKQCKQSLPFSSVFFVKMYLSILFVVLIFMFTLFPFLSIFLLFLIPFSFSPQKIILKSK